MAVAVHRWDQPKAPFVSCQLSVTYRWHLLSVLLALQLAAAEQCTALIALDKKMLTPPLCQHLESYTSVITHTPRFILILLAGPFFPDCAWFSIPRLDAKL